ncbi:MAG TPA: IS200/IS605 family transposase [Ignavibacteriales bacterium]|nr:IS200/IS605 family transposase [Ignavibacteriales bacterium]
MPFIKMWAHVIWATKLRQHYIPSDLKPKLISHIKQNSEEKGIHIDFLNCTHDHIHLLISLGADQSLAKCIMLIKGESSHWINSNHLLNTHFEWQEEYIAVSVSESVVDRVRNYIKNQEEHHRRKSFSEEYQEFIDKYKFLLK